MPGQQRPSRRIRSLALVGAVAALLLSLLLPPTVLAQFFPPAVLNPGGTSDVGDDVEVDQVVDSNNVLHAVWASQVSYTQNSGGDWDIFYARFENGVWSTPELVNSYGATDGPGIEGAPRIAWSGGSVHVVWHSTFPFAGSGSDYDILYAQRSGGAWSTAQLVNSAIGEAYVDAVPTVAVRANGDVLVVWEGADPLALADRDIWWSLRPAGSSSFTTPLPLNSNAYSDSGDDWGPVALAPLPQGDVLAVWSTDDPFGPQVGGDRDVVLAKLPPPPAGTWGQLVEVSAVARGDSGDDQDPTVAVIGSPPQQEIHVAWSSTVNLGGAGLDSDILHTVIGPTALLPPMNWAGVANSAGTTDPANAHDTHPSLCVEPGGVLHLVWQGTDPTTGDLDVYHSTNATSGDGWSPQELLGWNGLVDQAGEDDTIPRVACAPNGVLSGVWTSDDDLGVGANTDEDILHALGLGRFVSRPRAINDYAQYDGIADLDERVALAVDSQNVLHAVWQSTRSTIGGTFVNTDLDVLHATLGPTGWSNPEVVNTSATSDSGADFDPQIVIDDGDRIHVVWVSNENIGGQAGLDSDLFHSVKDGSSWSAPELVNSSGYTDSGSDLAQRGLSLGPDGSLHVVWTSNGQDIHYARRTAGGWSTEEVVYSPSTAVFLDDLDLRVTGDGVPHVVWASDDPIGSSGADVDIFYSRKNGSSWTAPEFVNDAANDGAHDVLPSLAVAPDGGLHVVWTSDLNVDGAGNDADLLYSKRSGNSWSTPRLLLALGSTDTGVDSGASVVIDSRSVLHVAWTSDEPLLFAAAGTDADIFYTAVPLSTTPPADVPVLLANASGWADSQWDVGATLLLDRSERVHFAWASYDAMGGTVDLDLDVFHAFVPSSGSAVPGTTKALFADGFESGDVSAWSGSSP